MYRITRQGSMEEREKRALRRAKDIQPSHGNAIGPKPVSKPNNEKDYYAPVKPSYVVARKRRGVSGCRMSPEKRAAVETRQARRAEFFAGLRGE